VRDLYAGRRAITRPSGDQLPQSDVDWLVRVNNGDDIGV